FFQAGDGIRAFHVTGVQTCALPISMVVLWPAMGVPAGYYRPFLTGLRRAGLAVAAVDLRGTGTSTPHPSRASRYGYAELTDDVRSQERRVGTAARPCPPARGWSSGS